MLLPMVTMASVAVIVRIRVRRFGSPATKVSSVKTTGIIGKIFSRIFLLVLLALPSVPEKRPLPGRIPGSGTRKDDGAWA